MFTISLKISFQKVTSLKRGYVYIYIYRVISVIRAEPFLATLHGEKLDIRHARKDLLRHRGIQGLGSFVTFPAPRNLFPPRDYISSRRKLKKSVCVPFSPFLFLPPLRLSSPETPLLSSVHFQFSLYIFEKSEFL